MTAILAALLLASVCAIVYAIVVPVHNEKFTEFYILGPGGKAENYPVEFSPGGQQSVIVGVANHEYGNVSYDMVVALNNGTDKTVLSSEQLMLSDNQTWQKAISLAPEQTGTNMKLDFLLYKNGNMTAPYRECYLLINVS